MLQYDRVLLCQRWDFNLWRRVDSVPSDACVLGAADCTQKTVGSHVDVCSGYCVRLLSAHPPTQTSTNG